MQCLVCWVHIAHLPMHPWQPQCLECKDTNEAAIHPLAWQTAPADRENRVTRKSRSDRLLINRKSRINRKNGLLINSKNRKHPCFTYA